MNVTVDFLCKSVSLDGSRLGLMSFDPKSKSNVLFTSPLVENCSYYEDLNGQELDGKVCEMLWLDEKWHL
jgi:hypothetical protein